MIKVWLTFVLKYKLVMIKNMVNDWSKKQVGYDKNIVNSWTKIQVGYDKKYS